MNPSDLYKAALGELQTVLTELIYKAYFYPTKVGDCSESTFEIVCPSNHVKDYLNKKFYGLLKNTLDRIGNGNYQIIFKVDEQKVETKTDDLPLFVPAKIKESASRENLDEYNNLSQKQQL